MTVDLDGLDRQKKRDLTLKTWWRLRCLNNYFSTDQTPATRLSLTRAISINLLLICNKYPASAHLCQCFITIFKKSLPQIAFPEVWEARLWFLSDVHRYLYWAATGPSCTGTRHVTPAVWRTRYRSSASVRTGRSWRATSSALWEEGEGGGGEGRRVEQVETAGEETEENRGKRETQILSSELFNSSCYLIPSKQPPQGRHYRRAGENWTVKSVLMDFYTSLPLTHSLHYFLPQKINAAHSPDSLWGLSFRAMYSFWLNGVLPTVTSSPFISIFTPVWVYEVHWEQLLTARSSLSA